MLIRPVTKEERLQSAQLLTIESGDLTISAADDAIHCDYTLQIGAEGTGLRSRSRIAMRGWRPRRCTSLRATSASVPRTTA